MTGSRRENKIKRQQQFLEERTNNIIKNIFEKEFGKKVISISSDTNYGLWINTIDNEKYYLVGLNWEKW